MYSDAISMQQAGLKNLHVHRLTQIYRARSEINQAIMRMTNEEDLFPFVCQIAVNFGGVSMAWIGVANPKTESIVPITSFGEGIDYLKHIHISTRDDQAEGLGPSATAFRNNRAVICNDWASNPLTAP